MTTASTRTPDPTEPRAREATTAPTMTAAVQRRYGPPEVVACARLARPVPRKGDVLVRVHAASVHPGDVFVVTGVPYVLRLAFGLRRPGSGVPGRDLAGRVEAVGAGVTELRPGDAVFGWTATGSLAEYVRAPARQFVPKPERLTMAQAATLTTSGLTALQALRDVARVQPGQTVLITGASGGVGTYAVQIAKAMGAEVTGVCSTRNVDMVRELGADHVVDYTAADFTRGGRLYDVILDNVEAQPLAATRRALAPTGTLIPNSGKGGRWFGPLGRILAAQVRSRFTRQRLRPFLSIEKHDDLLALAALVEAGTLTPVVDRTFPLEGASAALAYVGEGHARGKVVVSLGGSAGVGAIPQR
jgi:NADPH:quinone reductase-like Zn-dependent oxidoreductase